MAKIKMKAQIRCITLVGMIIFIYAINNYGPTTLTKNFVYTYIGRPILWLIVILIIKFFPRVKANGKIRLNSFLMWLTGLLGVGYVVIMILGGLIEGFGKSPYDHTIFGVITNFILVSTALIGREMTRSYLLNSTASKKSFTKIVLFSVLLTLTNISSNTISSLKTKFEVLQFLGEEFLPELFLNMLASNMVLIGGTKLSILYIGIQQAFMWLFPILPNIEGASKALIGTVYPFFCVTFLQYSYLKNVKASANRDVKKENPVGWIISTVIAILIVWFGVGVFPIRPMAIATGSMEPLIHPGDVVLVKNVDVAKLKLGDIIQYRSENINIFHRIINIENANGEIKYRTKGDNNSIADPELVKLENVKGKVVYTIPKLGWPTLLLKRDNSVEKEKVEF